VANEADAIRLRFLQRSLAMKQRTPEAIQLPAQHRIKPALACILHQPVKLWPACLGTAPAGINVLTCQLPASA